ncbi:MAG: hypothetical protein KC996_06955 [Phycisphaerales bacterium]|nr:hypothetical protein [Phycisphaerales bacterium]
MKMSARLCTLALAMAAGIALTTTPSMALPPENAISYQGVLSQDGTPVDGLRDFRFRLYDAATGGNLIETVQLFNVEVVEGLFSVELDWGVLPWASNEQRWVEIEAGPADGSQSYEFVARQKLTAVPYALNTRGITVDASGYVGFGVSLPVSPLHIQNGGPTSLEPWQNADLLLEGNSGDVSMAFLGPEHQEKVIMFGNNYNKDDGAIIYDKFGQAKRGMSFRTAQVERMQITAQGDVGIGTISPASRLDVRFATGNGIEVTDTQTSSSGIGVQSTVGAGTGVRGESTAGSGSTFGVYGQVASTAGWGVYSNGRLGASGTKSFMIDHPLDPAGSYLLHYSSESPEPQNRYNGNVQLDAQGRGVVVLPDYFEAINTDHRYTLTPIGAPAPNLYIESEIRGNVFVIAGGVPGQKISWEVISKRNDAFVQQRGAPIEIQKVGSERGKFLMPSLYGKPEYMGIYYRAPAE